MKHIIDFRYFISEAKSELSEKEVEDIFTYSFEDNTTFNLWVDNDDAKLVSASNTKDSEWVVYMKLADQSLGELDNWSQVDLFEMLGVSLDKIGRKHEFVWKYDSSCFLDCGESYPILVATVNIKFNI